MACHLPLIDDVRSQFHSVVLKINLCEEMRYLLISGAA